MMLCISQHVRKPRDYRLWLCAILTFGGSSYNVRCRTFSPRPADFGWEPKVNHELDKAFTGELNFPSTTDKYFSSV